MSTPNSLEIPWEVITTVGLDSLPADNPHLQNALLYGLGERYQKHGMEWIQENADMIRQELLEAARYAGEDLCSDEEQKTKCSKC